MRGDDLGPEGNSAGGQRQQAKAEPLCDGGQTSSASGNGDEPISAALEPTAGLDTSEVLEATEDILTLLPYDARILTVGDGNFVFSEALVTKRPRAEGNCVSLVATTLDSEAEIVNLYAEATARLARLRSAGVEVICGVDATKLGEEGHLAGMEPFDRIVFNFPLLPVRAHERGTRTADVHVANRVMLVAFMERVVKLLKRDGLVIIASKDCFPYSWWRLECLPQWAGGELPLLAMLPWRLTEYPSLYDGPCNVNRDASVKPTDAVIFIYGRSSMEDKEVESKVGNGKSSAPAIVVAFDAALKARSRAGKRPLPDLPAFTCDICGVRGMRTKAELGLHMGGKIHKKRASLEQRWEERLAGVPPVLALGTGVKRRRAAERTACRDVEPPSADKASEGSCADVAGLDVEQASGVAVVGMSEACTDGGEVVSCSDDAQESNR
eukprot:TRINITY_DN26991_c0_g1_i1.p1 TRINITY_DN26991_c0_g1~~TRINITY_DN26991_c0_g1_i1.p1  ORF type:complete len:439 (-),score=77.57 TRINITY_DN26991_c0_g1_i1:15-1331(-)